MWPILTNVTSNRKANAARFHLCEVPNQVKPNNIWVFIYYIIPYTAQVPYREPCHWPNYFVIGISDTHQHLSTTLSINPKLLCCGLKPHQTGLAPAFLLSSLLAHQPSIASVLFFTPPSTFCHRAFVLAVFHAWNTLPFVSLVRLLLYSNATSSVRISLTNLYKMSFCYPASLKPHAWFLEDISSHGWMTQSLIVLFCFLVGSVSPSGV